MSSRTRKYTREESQALLNKVLREKKEGITDMEACEKAGINIDTFNFHKIKIFGRKKNPKAVPHKLGLDQLKKILLKAIEKIDKLSSGAKE